MTAEPRRDEVARARRTMRRTAVVAGVALVTAAVLVWVVPPARGPYGSATTVLSTVDGGTVASGGWFSYGDGTEVQTNSDLCLPEQLDAIRTARDALPWRVSASYDDGDVVDGVCQGGTVVLEASYATVMAGMGGALQDAGLTVVTIDETAPDLSTVFAVDANGVPVELSVLESEDSVIVGLSSGFTGARPVDVVTDEPLEPGSTDAPAGLDDFPCTSERELAFRAVRSEIPWTVTSSEEGGDMTDVGCFGPVLVVEATYDEVVAGLPKVLAGAGIASPVVDAKADGSFAAFTVTVSGVEVQVYVSPVSPSAAEISINAGLF